MAIPEDKGGTNGTHATATGGRLPSCAKILAERFPRVRAVSLQLLEHNEAFRELCEEYEICSEAAERLERSCGNEPLRIEYAVLCLRLEGELLRCIARESSRGADGTH